MDRLLSSPPRVFFAGTGSLMLFSLGVAKYLKEHYSWEQGTVLSISGGGLPATALLTLPTEKFDAYASQIAQSFASLPLGLTRGLGSARIFQQAITSLVDESKLPLLRQRLLIKTTTLPMIRAKVYDGPYHTVDEVVNTLCASAYIPCLFFLRGPFPSHPWEVDGGLGAGRWKRDPWERTVVVSPIYSGNQDVWDETGTVFKEMRSYSYEQQMLLYDLGYQTAMIRRDSIEHKMRR